MKCNFSTDITNDEMDDELTNANDLPPEGVTEKRLFIFVNIDNPH